MPLLLLFVYIAVLAMIFYKIVNKLKEKMAASKYKDVEPQQAFQAACPYCSYDKPWNRPMGLCRCNECQRHFVPMGYHPTPSEAALLAEEEKECQIADHIAQTTDILQQVAADFSKQRPESQGMYKFQNGVVSVVYSDNTNARSGSSSRVVANYQPMKTLAGNMRLCLLCMEYLKNFYPRKFDLGEGFFGWE